MIKLLPLVGLGLAGTALAFVAFRAPSHDYVAPTAEEVAAHRAAPQALSAEVPSGCRVATIEVHGMCCLGCTGKLYDKLSATPGFVAGAVSFDEGVARAVIAADADPELFVSALRFGKYEARLLP